MFRAAYGVKPVKTKRILQRADGESDLHTNQPVTVTVSSQSKKGRACFSARGLLSTQLTLPNGRSASIVPGRRINSWLVPFLYFGELQYPIRPKKRSKGAACDKAIN